MSAPVGVLLGQRINLSADSLSANIRLERPDHTTNCILGPSCALTLWIESELGT